MYRGLIVLPNLQGGGAERVVLNLLEALSEDNKIKLDIFLFKNKIDYEIEKDSFAIYSSINREERLLFNLHKVYRHLKDVAKNYDVIIGGLELTPSYLGYIVAKKLKKPFIAWVHIALSKYLEHQSFIQKRLFSIFYPRFRYLVFPSYFASEDYKKLINKNQVIEVIPNPIDIDKITVKADMDVSEDILTLKPYILSIGRLEYQKGFDLLIKAFYNLSQEFSKIKLVILGEGKERPILEKLIKDMGLEDRVFLLGFKKNPYPYIKHCEFFILPSRFEGFGMVILESLALGKAVISTNCPYGPSEILQDGKYGVLVPPENVDALYNAMKSFIVNRNLVAFYESRAIERAREFSVYNIIQKWESFIERVIKNEI